jgi:hypothetical protein
MSTFPVSQKQSTRKSPRLLIKEVDEAGPNENQEVAPSTKVVPHAEANVAYKKRKSPDLAAEAKKAKILAAYEDFDKPEFSIHQLPTCMLSSGKLSSLHELCKQYAG